MNEENLIKYYNKFNEEKRLKTRHGMVEFNTTITYILKYLKELNNPKIIDIGAGAGAYSKYLADLGYEVEAIDLIKHNVRKIESLGIKAYQGNALDLSRYKDNSFDVTLLLGPMYHLIKDDDLIQALKEAKRITKTDGIIFVQYCMNDYAIITHGFEEHAIINAKEKNIISDDYKILANDTDLYRYVRIDDINYFNKEANLERIKIISPDGSSDYMRNVLNELSEEEFQEFLNFTLSICESPYLIGAGSHTLDILKKN